MSEGAYSIVILANGQFPCSNTALECLRQAEQIICCDGALDTLVAAGYEPTAIVGDMDSAQTASLQRWNDRLHPDKSEEYNDLQKALKYCISNELNYVTLLGCGGLREDHFIANLSIMATYSEQLDLKMVTDHGTFIAIRQTSTLPSFAGQQISIFCKDEQLPLTFHNLKYPVQNRCFQHLWEGSLNEALGDSFTIELHGEGVVVVYLGNCQ
ncbi:MAG: thiamine diphosphokinase [Bacteroidales bacterium]|nr:thiamine diphosphokinase [Bacteroidales bacterium]